MMSLGMYAVLLFLTGFLVKGEVSRTNSNFTKVLFPSVFKEYVNGAPAWLTNEEVKSKYGYSTFLYQKLYPNESNYIAVNRGTEAGVYLRYIVDHYDDLPDLMIFVHAHPEHHQPHWLEMIGCINPNATYLNINFQNVCRYTNNWKKIEIWIEQCWRDVLKIVWGLEDDLEEFNKRVPTSKPILACFVTAQQFVINRNKVRARPLHVWKKLLKVIGEQPACHLGEPDYENLYAYKITHERVGPEPSSLIEWDHPGSGYGAHTQGGAMEHLAHVVFGGYGLDMDYPNMDVICQHFLPNCPFSPCIK
jgi:hypothetical protein